jgi:hypothetical protein
LELFTFGGLRGVLVVSRPPCFFFPRPTHPPPPPPPPMMRTMVAQSEMMFLEAPALLQHFPRAQSLLRSMSHERAKYRAALHKVTSGPTSLEDVGGASGRHDHRERGSSFSSSTSSQAAVSKPLVSFNAPNYRDTEPFSREQQRRLAEQRRVEVKRTGKSFVELIDAKTGEGGGGSALV